MRSSTGPSAKCFSGVGRASLDKISLPSLEHLPFHLSQWLEHLSSISISPGGPHHPRSPSLPAVQQVDIYSFGMCMLEMITLDIPYSECDSVAKIYRKVTAGVRPAALGKVRDLEVRAFIERCLGAPRARPSAAKLLNDPFFNGIDDNAAAAAVPALGINCAVDGNWIVPNQEADGISALRLGGAAAANRLPVGSGRDRRTKCV